MRNLIFIFFFSAKLISQSDNSHNWNTNQKSIEVDFAFINSDSTLQDDGYFNYKRFYPEKGITEYGNVKQGKANGKWIYYAKSGLFMKGQAEDGFKVGVWNVTSGIDEGSFYEYNWNKEKTETKITQSKRVGKKPPKSKLKPGEKVIAK